MTFTFPFTPPFFLIPFSFSWEFARLHFGWERFWENFKDCRVRKEGSAGRRHIKQQSPAAKSEEKRLFSQARYNDIPHFQLAYTPVLPELFKVHASV